MEKKKKPESPEAEAETKAEQPAQVTPKFTIERLRKECYRIFGVTTSTFDGATYGLKDKFTVEEMQKHLDEWRKKRVNPANKSKEVN